MSGNSSNNFWVKYLKEHGFCNDCGAEISDKLRQTIYQFGGFNKDECVCCWCAADKLKLPRPKTQWDDLEEW